MWYVNHIFIDQHGTFLMNEHHHVKLFHGNARFHSLNLVSKCCTNVDVWLCN